MSDVLDVRQQMNEKLEKIKMQGKARNDIKPQHFLLSHAHIFAFLKLFFRFVSFCRLFVFLLACLLLYRSTSPLRSWPAGKMGRTWCPSPTSSSGLSWPSRGPSGSTPCRARQANRDKRVEACSSRQLSPPRPSFSNPTQRRSLLAVVAGVSTIVAIETVLRLEREAWSMVK